MPLTSRIGLLVGPVDPFWVQVREAIHKKAQSLSVEVIAIDFSDRSTTTAEDQMGLLEELLALEVDALIDSSDLPAQLVYRILGAGLPVIHLSETSISHPLSTAPLGLYEVARMGAAYLAQTIANRSGEVIILGGLLEYFDDGTSRLAGIKDAFADYPSFTLRHIPTVWRAEIAYNQIYQELAKAKKAPIGMFGLSDSLALAGRDAGKRLGLITPDTLIVGINGDPLALAAIADKSMLATVETSATELATTALELVLRATEGEKLPSHFSYNPRLVTASNVGEVALQKLVAIADLPNRLVGLNRQQDQQRLSQLETSLEINRRAGSVLDRQQLSHAIADLIRVSYGYDQVQLFLWNALTQILTLDEPENAEGGTLPTVIPLASGGLLKEALERNETIFVPDTHQSYRFPPDPAWPQTRSRVVVPVRLGEEILALLDLHSYHSTQHSHQELVGLQTLADQLGIAMRNAELYKEALQARVAAEKADQLKTRLLANISHEFRTPLNVILGYSQTALSNPNPYNQLLPAGLTQDLGHIYRSGEHLIRLVNDLLDLSRAEIDELDLFPQIFDPYPFLEEVFNSLAGQEQEGRNWKAGEIEWRLDMPDNLPFIQADPVRLRQILFNLLSNARKFTRKGFITLGAEVNSPYLHLWIEDTGEGIPLELQEQIFEPFVSAVQTERDGRATGIGLGLSITRRLIALHRGKIRVESQPGKGSIFHVYLPLPNLEERASPSLPTSEREILVFAGSKNLSPALQQLSERSKLAVRIVTLNNCPRQEEITTLQPVALALDFSDNPQEVWQIFQKFQAHPTLFQLPLLVFGQVTSDTNDPIVENALTGMLTKPLNASALSETLATIVAQGAEPANPRLVLVIDDDVQAHELYTQLLTREFSGYLIRHASDGLTGLALAEAEKPGLIILDLMMPDLNGFEVLRELRMRPLTRHIPVIVMSGKTLSFEEVSLLDFTQVQLQTKDILTPAELFEQIGPAVEEGFSLPQQTSILVKKAIIYLQQNYRKEELTRQEIADAVGVSKSYFNQIFQEEVGITPGDYLTRYRIKQAKLLLEETNDAITVIANSIGFTDPSYFARVFRREVGMSPQRFREQCIKTGQTISVKSDLKP